MTVYEKLEDHLLEDYEFNEYLGHVSQVKITNLDFSQLKYNEKKKFFTVSVKMEYSFHDNRLQWNPEFYKNISTYDDVIAYIWKPSFMLSEKISYMTNSLSFKYETAIKHTGDVFVRSKDFEVTVWCDIKELKSFCDLQIYLDEPGVALLNYFDIKKEQIDKLNEKSPWKVKNIAVSNETHVSFFPTNGNIKTRDLNFRFYLERNTSSRLGVFYSTLIAGLVLLMLSTWVSDFLKISLIMIAVLIFVLSLILTSNFAPSTNVVKIGECV